MAMCKVSFPVCFCLMCMNWCKMIIKQSKIAYRLSKNFEWFSAIDKVRCAKVNYLLKFSIKKQKSNY